MAASAPEIAGLPFGWAAIFGILNTLGLGTIAVAWIRSRATNRRVELDGYEKLRSEMWRDIEALKVSREDQSRRLGAAETKIASQTVQIGQLRFISALVIDELERRDPGNTIARQARMLLDRIQPDAMPGADEIAPITETLTKLGSTRGVGE